MLVDEPEGSDDGYDGKETRYDPPYIMRLEYDLVVLEKRRSLLRGLGREASRIDRHDLGHKSVRYKERERERETPQDRKRARNQDQEIVGPSR